MQAVGDHTTYLVLFLAAAMKFGLARHMFFHFDFRGVFEFSHL